MITKKPMAKTKLVKLNDGIGQHIHKEQFEKSPFAMNQPVSVNWWVDISTGCSDDSIQILLKLARIVTLTYGAVIGA